MRASREIVPARIAERFSVPITLMREVATATGGAAWTSASRVEADRCWTWWWEGMVRYGKSRRVCVCVCVCEREWKERAAYLLVACHEIRSEVRNKHFAHLRH